MRFRLALVAVVGMACAAAEHATAADIQILARCGPSTGQSYYFEGGIVGPGQGGWKPDGYANGRITALLNESEQVDIIFRDADGTRSLLRDGMKVALTSFDEASLSFIVSTYSNKVSGSYLFKMNKLGVGTVVWTESKALGSITRSSIMVAECGPSYEIKP
ncbi:hypothetical protein [Methylobacterium sp.]|uniref:hypothetical protein n=1 Tax=Methylobacterium sp. TaxID=409 RepID=UPI0025E78EDF|nr:hypothetical protein [Methylobacterium sp.]MBY0257478.1 hypothetical protein [Methylobacterium sp.]